MFIKAPFPIPSGFLRSFGYPGPRRFVALFWTPMGDEACFDDGQSSACGLTRQFGKRDLMVIVGMRKIERIARFRAGITVCSV